MAKAEAYLSPGLVVGSEKTPDWFINALCRSTMQSGDAIFFPSDSIGLERAVRVCASCLASTECLEYALTYRIEHGVWGGRSERERQRILRRRKLTA